MQNNMGYNILFILIGTVLLVLGFTGKNPNYGGGIVHKYFGIILGFICLLYGIFSMF